MSDVSLKNGFKKPGWGLLMALPVFVFLSLSVSQLRAESDQFSLCKLDREVRTLRVQKNDGRCLAIYNKYGKDQNVGEAQYESSCQSILGRVQNNLVEAGWKCRAVKSSGITDLSTSGVE